MPQKYKVFFNHNVVCFGKSKQPIPENSEIIFNPNIENLKSLCQKLIGQTGDKNYYISCDDINTSWKEFRELFIKKSAAGGLVINSQEQILMIKRNGVWDLPKGHIEKGEKKRKAAIREVEEECGIHDLQIGEKIIKTYHTYILKNKWIIKPTHWYLMNSNSNETFTPQTEEGITEVKWISKNEIGYYYKNTYPSIQEVIKQANDFLADFDVFPASY